jgi:hypothetical protein
MAPKSGRRPAVAKLPPAFLKKVKGKGKKPKEGSAAEERGESKAFERTEDESKEGVKKRKKK